MKAKLVIVAVTLSAGFFFLSVGAARADSTQTAPIYHVQQVDPDFDVGGMAGPGVQVHKQPGSELPSLEERDQAIHQAGLQEQTAQWDELDKDLLYLRARDAASLDVLKAHYPKFSGENLAKFRDLVQAKR